MKTNKMDRCVYDGRGSMLFRVCQWYAILCIFWIVVTHLMCKISYKKLSGFSGTHSRMIGNKVQLKFDMAFRPNLITHKCKWPINRVFFLYVCVFVCVMNVCVCVCVTNRKLNHQIAIGNNFWLIYIIESANLWAYYPIKWEWSAS